VTVVFEGESLKTGADPVSKTCNNYTSTHKMEKSKIKSTISNVIHHLQKAYGITTIHASTGSTNKALDSFHL